MQEVLAHQSLELQQALPNYQAFGRGRQADGSGEQCLVLVRRTLLIEDWGIRWLSETPELCSVGWDAVLPRIFTWVKLRSATTPLLLLNTHFDHLGHTARMRSSQQLLDFVADSTAVVAGDLNALPDSAPVQLLLRQLQDANPEAAGTYHDFGREPEPYRIDYLLHTADLEVVHSQVVSDNSLSDHYPVMAQFTVAGGPYGEGT